MTSWSRAMACLLCASAPPLAAQEAKPGVSNPTASAASKPAAPPDNLRPSDTAMALARVMQPADLILTASAQIYRDMLGKMLTDDADFVKLEKKHPGLISAVVEEVVAEMIATDRKGMPRMHRRYAALYESMFEPSEMVEMTRLYTSPVGRKMLQAKLANVDATPVAASVMANPDGPIERKSLQSINDDATAKAAKAMTEEELKTVAAMMRPSTLIKMRLAQPSIIKFETEIANEEDPALKEAVAIGAERAMKRFGL